MKELTPDELQNVTVRANLLAQKRLEFELLNAENALYLRKVLEKKGLDVEKTYKIAGNFIIESENEEGSALLKTKAKELEKKR